MIEIAVNKDCQLKIFLRIFFAPNSENAQFIMAFIQVILCSSSE